MLRCTAHILRFRAGGPRMARDPARARRWRLRRVPDAAGRLAHLFAEVPAALRDNAHLFVSASVVTTVDARGQVPAAVPMGE